MGTKSNLRQMPPAEALGEAPERVGQRITFAYLAAYADLAPRMERLGLSSPSRILALFHIKAHPGCSQSELAGWTGLSRASAMMMTNQLEEARIIERRSGPNARTNALYLTAHGASVLEKIVEQTAANERLIFGCLTDDERRTLIVLLEKVVRDVEARRSRKKASTKSGP
ncbi:MAG: winged helix-turn-helix transcriptional regulator [Hyphomonadaceae bacterium]|nr:winged helix-turn-helix transcriptional regulator [Hyphomonadaceae bacterium]